MTTVYVLSGSRYHGAYYDAEIVDAADRAAHGLELRGDPTGFVVVIGAREPDSTCRVLYVSRPADIFETEQDARTEAKARRRPRRPRAPQALYGDFAQLAAFHGIRTDGTGRRAR